MTINSNSNEALTIETTDSNENETENAVKWDGTDEDFWHAVEIFHDPEAEEVDSIMAAIVLQQVLRHAQDAVTRPATDANSAGTPGISIPARVIAKPKTGEVVEVLRAVELFADGWVLRPAGLVPGHSTLSAVRDYRVHEGRLQYNASYPAQWQDSNGTISDCPQWLVVVQQSDVATLRTA